MLTVHPLPPEATGAWVIDPRTIFITALPYPDVRVIVAQWHPTPVLDDVLVTPDIVSSVRRRYDEVLATLPTRRRVLRGHLFPDPPCQN